jgi:hypothetical protein
MECRSSRVVVQVVLFMATMLGAAGSTGQSVLAAEDGQAPRAGRLCKTLGVALSVPASDWGATESLMHSLLRHLHRGYVLLAALLAVEHASNSIPWRVHPDFARVWARPLRQGHIGVTCVH